jgi:ribosomal-protein-alanine N-acetyltransferase
LIINSLTAETERLLLRPFEESEADIVASNSRQPSVADEMSDKILADEEAGLKWIKWINAGNDFDRPCQILAIELKKEKRCIGIIGIAPQSKIDGEFEILFSISDDYQNNGYATEASRKIIDWFFEQKESCYICAIVKTKNIPSQKVIEKLGFEFIENREIVYDYKPTMFKYYKLQHTL